MGIEAILALLGVALPPAMQLLKGWLMPAGKDTPEATISTLATTKPEVITGYTEAVAKLKEAETKFFNRDVIGVPSKWIIDLRAGIRPAVTAIGCLALIAEGMTGLWYPEHALFLDEGTRGLFILTTSFWFGGRLFNGKS